LGIIGAVVRRGRALLGRVLRRLGGVGRSRRWRGLLGGEGCLLLRVVRGGGGLLAGGSRGVLVRSGRGLVGRGWVWSLV